MPTSDQYPPVACYDLTAAIANGQTASGAVDLLGAQLVGLLMPAAFTGTALTFQAAEAIGGTYRTLYDAGADLSVTVAAAKFVVLDPSKFAGVRFLKVVSGSAEGADRTLTLATRPV